MAAAQVIMDFVKVEPKSDPLKLPSGITQCLPGTTISEAKYQATGSGVSNYDLVLFLYSNGDSYTTYVKGATCVYDTNVNNRPIFGYLQF